jgi:hypothetical protein
VEAGFPKRSCFTKKTRCPDSEVASPDLKFLSTLAA